MVRYTRQNPRFRCGTAMLEKIVLASVKALIAALVDREELKLDAFRQGESEKAELADRLRSEENAVQLLEESVAKNFTALVSGKLSKDSFVSKKEVINNAVAQKNAELEQLRECLHALTTGKAELENRLSELRPLLTVEKLDRALVDLTIDKILVHGEQEIEIIWADRFS
jgi:hypothetical protein